MLVIQDLVSSALGLSTQETRDACLRDVKSRGPLARGERGEGGAIGNDGGDGAGFQLNKWMMSPSLPY